MRKEGRVPRRGMNHNTMAVLCFTPLQYVNFVSLLNSRGVLLGLSLANKSAMVLYSNANGCSLHMSCTPVSLIKGWCKGEVASCFLPSLQHEHQCICFQNFRYIIYIFFILHCYQQQQKDKQHLWTCGSLICATTNDCSTVRAVVVTVPPDNQLRVKYSIHSFLLER